MLEKATNDAVAYIRSLARERGRNEEWVEKAVRASVSITETEAVKLHVVDALANNFDDVLKMSEGRSFKIRAVKKPSAPKTPSSGIALRCSSQDTCIISDPCIALYSNDFWGF
jgi:membrane-bound serine protease (ClpP class)